MIVRSNLLNDYQRQCYDELRDDYGYRAANRFYDLEYRDGRVKKPHYPVPALRYVHDLNPAENMLFVFDPVPRIVVYASMQLI